MIADRLKLAREARGLSLRDLEAKIDKAVSAQAIGKYERGEMMPGSTVLLALSNALNVSPEYLLSARKVELTGVDFRKSPHAVSAEERAVRATIMDHVERYLELEEILDLPSEEWLAPSGRAFSVGSIEAAERAAEELRRAWDIGFDAIPSLTELLEERGVKIAAVALPESVFGSKAMVTRKGKPAVPVMLVNARHNGERQRFTLAHELAHLILRPSRSMSPGDAEKAADRFAGAFLVPRESLLREIGEHRREMSLGELIALKRVFLVSIATIVVRCSQVGILSPVAYRRLWQEIKALGFMTPPYREPEPLPPETPRRMERLCFRAVSEGALSEAKAAELLNITVRELDKRLAPTEDPPAR